MSARDEADYQRTEYIRMLELLNQPLDSQIQWCDPVCYDMVMEGNIETLKSAGCLYDGDEFHKFNLCSIRNCAMIIMACKDHLVVEHNKKLLAKLKTWLENHLGQTEI